MNYYFLCKGHHKVQLRAIPYGGYRYTDGFSVSKRIEHWVESWQQQQQRQCTGEGLRCNEETRTQNKGELYMFERDNVANDVWLSDQTKNVAANVTYVLELVVDSVDSVAVAVLNHCAMVAVLRLMTIDDCTLPRCFLLDNCFEQTCTPSTLRSSSWVPEGVAPQCTTTTLPSTTW